MSQFDLDLSGLLVRLEGVTTTAETRLHEEWGTFAGASDPGHRPAPFLRLDVLEEERGVLPHQYDPKRMLATTFPGGARFEMPEGVATVDRAGLARIRLAPNLGAKEFFTIENLVRACLAFSLPARGAALLHAAGLVVQGRAFLLAGQEGSGKSTWAALGQREGASVISDDLILVDRGADGPLVRGAPFRSSRALKCPRGCWPLAAILFPRHGSPATLCPVSALVTRARIAANLPFIAEAVGRDPFVAAVLESLAANVPCLELTFDLDPSFLSLLRDLAAGPGRDLV